MKYTKNYNLIFASCRVMLNNELTKSFEHVRTYTSRNYSFSRSYLCELANLLTAYNELTNLSFFAKSKHFINP